MTWVPTIGACDEYLAGRTGSYEQRAVRYRAAADWLRDNGLDDSMTVVDVGAGMTEFDYCLRAEYGWRGRYVPVDGGIDGTDLNWWVPRRQADFFVALEIIEHLTEWSKLLFCMQGMANRGVVLSTPNPNTTDVLGMDSTHVVAVQPDDLRLMGFEVTEATFYGGRFSDGRPDSLFATWRAS